MAESSGTASRGEHGKRAVRSDDRLLPRPEVERIASIGRSAIYRGIDAGTFPEPVRVGPRSVRWLLSEVLQWIASRPRSRGDGARGRGDG